MIALVVRLKVKPEHREAFLAETRLNHLGTRQEPGNLRFDVLAVDGDPDRFLLYEVYRSKADIDAHRATAHYQRWNEKATPLLAEPRTRDLAEVIHPVPWG